MRASINNLVKVMTTGFVVLTLLSLPLFWLHYICERNLIDVILLSEARNIRLEPSGLVPDEIENDPNVTNHSCIHARLRNEGILGFTDYFEKRYGGEQFSTIYFNDRQVIYFNKSSGHLISKHQIVQETPDGTSTHKYVTLYIGPEGFSETPNKKLGRFTSPITDTSLSYRGIVYDKKLRRFFLIKFDEKIVAKGPQLPKDDPHKPVKIGSLRKNPGIVNLDWDGPRIKLSNRNIEKSNFPGEPTVSTVLNEVAIEDGRFFLVLDETGRIDLLDRETLEFTGIAGHLPASDTLFSDRQIARPKDLLAYDVLPLTLNTDHQYRGMFVATVNREGTDMALYVFDKDGKTVKRAKSIYTYYTHSGREEMIPSGKAVYFHNPWGPVPTITKYLLENLHPPVLSITSYFTANSFEAASGHSALFVLPNSFIAMKGRDVKGNFASRFSFALLLILPSIVFSIFLAWRVGKDAAVIGLSDNERLFWILGTIAFGLVAYITYRLIRPKSALVTCQNCGKPRRPDMDRCHRCKSKWYVPELIPPAWRVVD